MAFKITQADLNKIQAALPILSQLSADMSQDFRYSSNSAILDNIVAELTALIPQVSAYLAAIAAGGQ